MKHSAAACLLFAAVVAVAMPVRPCAAADRAAPVGLQPDLRFTQYAPLARASELMRRLLSPLQAHRANAAIEQSKRALSDQSIDPAQERFALYVPADARPAGYALLVFVPPWEQATFPTGWIGALDRHGMILATAAHSGNDASVLDRREPLALTAAYNVMRRYRVDPARVYVGGFSGGSRVALRLAFGYPDLFHGALLDAGSDPIGTTAIPLPPADLMHRFQETTRLVYLTGREDAPRLAMDEHSRDSMRDWCVFDLTSVPVAWSGHEAAGAAAFAQGLDALERHEHPAPEKLAACRRRYEESLADQLHEAATLRASGKADAADAMLRAVDARYGGLAAGTGQD